MNNKVFVKIDLDLKDLIPKYLKNRDVDILLCKKNLRENNFKFISEVGHKIRGNAATYGFIELSNIGERLELSALSNNPKETENALKDFENYIQNIEIEYVKV